MDDPAGMGAGTAGDPVADPGGQYGNTWGLGDTYLDLEVWFHGSFRRAAEARRAAATRVARPRKADPVRTPADIELRPPQSTHRYRYQLHRLPDAG